MNMDDVVSRALEAFWQEVADSYPQAKTGDLPPDVHASFDQTAEAAVEVWVSANVPQNEPAVTSV